MFFIQEPSVDASHHTSGPEGYHDSQMISGTADSLHSNGKSSLPTRPGWHPRAEGRGCGIQPPLRVCPRLSDAANLTGEEGLPSSLNLQFSN